MYTDRAQSGYIINKEPVDLIFNLWILFLTCNMTFNLIISTSSTTSAEFIFHPGTFNETKEVTAASTYRQDLLNGYSPGQLPKI